VAKGFGVFSLVVLGMLVCIQPTRAADVGRKVFAHYMVCIPTYGGDSKVADYQREIRAAQAAGIDGFALNCGGWTLREPHYKKRMLLIYQAAEEMGTGFKLFISADYASGLTFDETRDMVESFRSHPSQFCYDGKPVLSTFGGKRAQTDFVAKEFTGSRAICYVPFYYPTPASEMPNQAQVDQVFRDHSAGLDGFFHFGAAGTPAQIARSNHLLAEKWLGAGKLFMASVTPHYRGLGGNYRVYESRGFEGLAQQWEGAIRDKATWVEIVTWNDWGEASYVAPFGAPFQTYHWGNHWGPMLSHAAFLNASRYYIDWYKTGVQPAIKEDAIYYFYRAHPKAISGIKKPGDKEKVLARPGGADKLADDVFATVFLAAPAQLTIYSGAVNKAFDLPAGVQHLSMPFAPGPPRFVLTRGGETIIDKSGEQEISATEAWGNFNIFAGEARPLTVRVQHTEGGPQICVNGKPVPPRFFWGSENSGRVVVNEAWGERAFEFTTDSDAAGNGTLHFRFLDTPGEVWIKDLRLTDSATGADVLPSGSFASSETFGKVWSSWPVGAENTVGAIAVADGALRVTLSAPKGGGLWPDFHLHSRCPLSFAKGHTYRCAYRVKGKPNQEIMPCIYRVDSGAYARIGGPQGSFYSQVALARDAGVNLVSFAAPTCWAPPEQTQDWAPVDALCRRIIAVNPTVLLVPRFDANAPHWWQERHPESRMVYDGTTLYPVACVSDRAYRGDMCAHLEKLARHLSEAFPDNFAGLHPCGQNTGEWFYYNSWANPLSGYDPATRAAFREWLKQRGDAAAATAEPPTPEERRGHPNGFLRDPAREGRLIEFARFQQQEMSDFVAALAAACRRGTGGKKLVVFFYGYGFEFAPLGNGAPTSGHYALGSLLKSKDIDILCSPLSYTDREWLGTTPVMSAAESVKRAGILWLNEDDSRTYLDPRKQEHVQEGGLVNLKQTQQVMLRNTAQAALRGLGTWWMDLPGQGWFNDAAIWHQIERLRPVDEAMLQREAPFSPEIAAIIDEDSMCHLTGGSALAARPLIYEGRAALGRSGAPYGQYLLSDVLDGKVPARMQVFLSAWRLTAEQRKALATQREAGFMKTLEGWLGMGRVTDVTRIWCWAPGYLYPARADVAGIQEVTGFAAKAVTLPTAVATPTELGRKHGLTQAWGPKSKIEPLFCVTATVGDVWATYSDGSPAVALRRSTSGLDVFVGVPQLTPELVHALAKASGVHLFTQPGPALWAANGYLSVQAHTIGPVVFNTGRKQPVSDALDGMLLGKGPRLELNMEQGEVRVLRYHLD
jgi:hypothetical protein